MRMLRIAVLGSRGYGSTYGGFETLVRYLAPYLRDRGHHVTVYCRQGTGFRWGRGCIDGIDTIVTPGLSSKSLGTLTFGLTASLDTLFRNYDAIIVLNSANGLFLPVLRSRSAKTIVNVDGMEWDRAKWNRLGKATFRLGARMCARLADVVVADSQEISRVWSDLFGRHTVFIPYGATAYRGRPDERVRAMGLTPSRYHLVVARMAPENNISLILDAFELSRTTYPLVVVGDSNYRNAICDRLRRLHDSADVDVRWLGHIADQELLIDLWAHCAAYLHGHSVGGTNPALLQAMGAGSPVLAFDTPFNREVIQNSDQLFGPDPALLAVQMTELGSDQSLRAKYRDVGQRRIREAYQWEAVCESYLALCT